MGLKEFCKLMVYAIKDNGLVKDICLREDRYRTKSDDIILTNGMKVKEFNVNENNDNVKKGDIDTIYFIKSCILQSECSKLNETWFYYEIKIMDLKPDADIFIGYASDSKKIFNYNHILLSSKNNGVIVNSINHKNSYEPTLKRGDIIGCYYDMIGDKVIFIYNGIELCSFDYSFDGLPLSKTISCTPGTLIKYNFGNRSFSYRKVKLGKRATPHEKTEEILPSYMDAKINYNL